MIKCIKCNHLRRNRAGIMTDKGPLCGKCLGKRSKKVFKKWREKNPYVKTGDIMRSATVTTRENLIVRSKKLFRKLMGKDKK